YGASIAPGCPGNRRRLAREYSLLSFVESLPVAGSMRCILIPLQKLPNASHWPPSSSMARLGSIALKSSDFTEPKTLPWSTQGEFGLFGSSVLLVTRPISDMLLPKVDTA